MKGIIFLLMIAMSAQAQVGYWSFDGCDRSPSVTVGSASLAQGYLGQGISFEEGTNIQEAGFDFTEQMSVSAWFKTTDGGMIVSKDNHPSLPRRGYLLHINKEGSSAAGTVAINCFAEDGARAVVNSGNFNSEDYRDGQWHHVVGTCRTKAKLYIDGSYIGESVSSISSIGVNNEPFVIGGRPSSPYPYSGVLDEIKVFDREIALSDVSELFSATTEAGECLPEMAIHWNFEQCRGNKTYDTVSGLEGIIGSYANWEGGHQGTGLSFTPESYLASVVGNHQDFGSAVTVAAWIKTDFGGMIFSKEDPTQQIRKGFLLHMNNGESSAAGTIAINCFSENGNRFKVNSGDFNNIDYRDGNWHHIVGICDSERDNRAKLYVDGDLIGVSEKGLYSIGVNEDLISVGDRPTLAYPFIGVIDDLKIFHGPLSEGDVFELAGQEPTPSFCPRDLIGFWAFDSCQYGIAVDQARDFTGFFKNHPFWIEGFINQALYFHKGSYVEIEADDLLGGENGVSISVLAKTDVGGMIVSKVNAADEIRKGYSLHMNMGSSSLPGSVAINCYGNDGTRLNVNSMNYNQIDYRDDEWHHYVAICDVLGEQRARLYIDGELIGSSDERSWNIGKNEEPLTIGDRPSSAYPFEGIIDEVRLYAGALSEFEIQSLWNSDSNPGSCSMPPMPIFIVDHEMIAAPAKITFDASLSYDQDDQIVAYDWDFGDSSNGGGVRVEHTYFQEGAYEVTLSLRDESGKISKYKKTIIVTGESTTHPNGGGFISPDATVSNEVFVSSGAAVTGEATLLGGTSLAPGARVYGSAVIEDSLIMGTVGDDAIVTNNAIVLGTVLGEARVDGSKITGEVSGNALVQNQSVVHGKVFGQAQVDNSTVLEGGSVYGEAIVESRSVIEGRVYDRALVISSYVFDRAQIFGDAQFINSTAFENAKVNYSVEEGSCSGDLQYDQENCFRITGGM